MQKWAKNGWAPANTEYPASIALFTSGKAAMHINGVWEVPTMVDLAKKGQLFDWGAIQIPVFFAHPATWADSHSFAIPDRKGNPVPPEKRKIVLDTIHWFNVHSLEWAAGGHIPAYLPVQESAAFKALKPNSDYASLAKTAVFDPVSVYTGVASPAYDAAGNYMIPALNGEISPGRRPRRSATTCRATSNSALKKAPAVEPAPAAGALFGLDDIRSSPACVVEAHASPRLPAKWVALKGGRAETHAQKPTQRNFDRRGPDGAVRRHLRRPVRLSDDQDGRSELHQRAADRGGQMGRLRQFRASRTDRLFSTAVWNTLYFVALSVIPGTLLALFVALGVNRLKGWLQSLVLAAFFLPYILPVSVVFRSGAGFSTRTLASRNMPSPPSTTASTSPIFRIVPLFIPAVAFVTVWWCLGFNVLLYIAGLRNISSEIYEAAESRRRQPLNDLPAHHLAAHLARDGARLHDPAHSAVQDFRSGLSVRHAAGRPTMVMVQYIYKQAFQMNKGGLASRRR